MKILVTGTRGIPDIPGGVETHCQELYPRLIQYGHEIILIRRESYVYDNLKKFKNVNLHDIFTPKKKSLEAIIHTFLAVIHAVKIKPDIIHIHSIGPCILVPIAKLFGFKVVVTNHGPDYNRDKWGFIARIILKLGERLGSNYSDGVIVISKKIYRINLSYYSRKIFLIYNGVDKNPSNENYYLKRYQLRKNSYIFTAARFVPEKGLHDLINAYNLCDLGLKLVIAGDSDHEDEYSKNLKLLAKQNKNITLTGYITGKELDQLFSNALMYVIPSYHEGLPITLLEAMSYNIKLLASDIEANKEVGLNKRFYFKCGDVQDLKNSLLRISKYRFTDMDKKNIQNMLQNKFNWDIIAKQTSNIYKSI